MVILVYVLVSTDTVCEVYKFSYHTALSCCCTCKGTWERANWPNLW